MGEIGQGLNQLGQPGPHTLINRYREDYRRGDADKELPEAIHEGISEELGKIERLDKGLKVLKANPFTPPYPFDGHKVLKGDLAVPNGKIFKNDIVGQGNDEEGINGPVPFDLLPLPLFARYPIIHDSNNIRELPENDADLLDYSDIIGRR
jgi:hypothetical protein